VEFFSEDPWLAWVILAGLFTVGEITTAGLLLIFLAGGALAAAVAAAAGAGVLGSAAVFGLVSIALIAFARPIAKRHMYQAPLERSGTAALIGTEAYVVEAVDSRDGRVKIGGEIWSARSMDPEATFAPGAQVSVLQIDGATAVVA
jgi:membrane protein implicated in regulation of membrane protease activity